MGYLTFQNEKEKVYNLIPLPLFLKTNPEEAAPTQHVRDLGKNFNPHSTTPWMTVDEVCPIGLILSLFFPQDDDVDGEHIVAFAEEADLGKATLH